MMMDNNAIGRSNVGTQFKSVGDNKQQGDDEQKKPMLSNWVRMNNKGDDKHRVLMSKAMINNKVMINNNNDDKQYGEYEQQKQQ